MTKSAKTTGFTIVELMVTLAVAAILMGFAVPAFNDFLRQRTMTSGINDFVLAVTYARSEAVRRGEEVSVQADDDSDADNEWGKGGYCVVIGTPGNCANPSIVLRRFSALDDQVYTLNATAGTATAGTLTFSARGLLTPMPAAASRIDLCAEDEDVDPGRRIIISLTGRPDSQELDCHA